MGGVNYSAQSFEEMAKNEGAKKEQPEVVQLIEEVENNLKKIKNILLTTAE